MASERHTQQLLVVLVLAAVALVVALAKPFWVPLLFAAAFAAALDGWTSWLARLLRGRRRLAAFLVTAGVLLAVLVPLGGLGAGLVREVVDGVQWVRGALESEGFGGLLHRLPQPVEELARRIFAAIPDPKQALRDLAGASGGEAAQAVGGLLVATGAALLKAVLFLIALYFLLTDGGRLVEWLDGHVPLRPGQLRALLTEFRRTSVSVLVASLGTALIQTSAGAVGFLIARAPNPLFLTLATFVVALVPAVGGAIVVVSAGLLLLATGHPVSGAFLVIWGAAVVSMSDNIARPLLLRGGVAVHGGLLFVALLGGLAAFGGTGLLVGPLALTFLLTALEMYRREFGAPAGTAAPPAPAPPPAVTAAPAAPAPTSAPKPPTPS